MFRVSKSFRESDEKRQDHWLLLNSSAELFPDAPGKIRVHPVPSGSVLCQSTRTVQVHSSFHVDKKNYTCLTPARM